MPHPHAITLGHETETQDTVPHASTTPDIGRYPQLHHAVSRSDLVALPRCVIAQPQQNLLLLFVLRKRGFGCYAPGIAPDPLTREVQDTFRRLFLEHFQTSGELAVLAVGRERGVRQASDDHAVDGFGAFLPLRRKVREGRTTAIAVPRLENPPIGRLAARKGRWGDMRLQTYAFTSIVHRVMTPTR